MVVNHFYENNPNQNLLVSFRAVLVLITLQKLLSYMFDEC